MTDKVGGLLPLYLRREPSTHPDAPSYKGRRAFDVLAYSDAAGKRRKAYWPWFRTDKPRNGKRQASTIVLNCFRWTIIWLPDVVEEVPRD